MICIQVMITHRSGHVYFVGECGNPMEETDCPVEGCFERIGGQWGRLVTSNRSVSEFVTVELIILCQSERSQDKIHVQIQDCDHDHSS